MSGGTTRRVLAGFLLLVIFSIAVVFRPDLADVIESTNKSGSWGASSLLGNGRPVDVNLRSQNGHVPFGRIVVWGLVWIRAHADGCDDRRMDQL